MHPRQGGRTPAVGRLNDHTWTFAQTQFAYGIFYNTDLFEQNGWPAPDSFVAFRERNWGCAAAIVVGIFIVTFIASALAYRALDRDTVPY